MVAFSAALTHVPVAEWASAVNVRRSVRTFTGRPVDAGTLAVLSSFCDGLPGREVARVVVLREAPEELFTGVLVGSYGRVLGAPSALLVIGCEQDKAVQQSMGYLGEAAILQATAMSLGTCWIAGSFDRSVAGALTSLDAGERIFAISPLGYPHDRTRPGERLMKAMVRARHRRPVTEIAPGFDEEHWPAWAAEGVRLARIAPSAVNRQPWRFALDADSMTFSVVERGAEGSISRLLDIGIAMLHFEIGARLMGAAGIWEVLDAPLVARYRPLPG